MTQPKNPYRPGVGLPPAVLAGRDSEIETFKRTLRSAPEIPGNVRLHGLRGVGKTVLLGELANTARELEWKPLQLEVEPRMNNEATLTGALRSNIDRLKQGMSTTAKIKAKAGKALDSARKAVTVTVEGFEWSLAGDLAQESRAIGDILLGAVEASQARGYEGFALLLDEAQILTDDKKAEGSHALSTLVAAVSTLQKAGVAISLVLCGLPTLAVNLLNARTYSERMFRGIEVGSLDSDAAKSAFIGPLAGGSISAEDAVVEEVLEAVEGYPYFIQLWGAELWDATVYSDLHEMTTGTLEEISGRIYERLDGDFYEPRIASLTPAEQDLLMDSANCAYPPLVVADLNTRSRKSSGNINVLLGRLVEANILFRVRKGQYQYTAPGFGDFLKRRASQL